MNGDHSTQYIQDAEFRAQVNLRGGGEADGKLPERYRLSLSAHDLQEYVFNDAFRISVHNLVNNPITQIEQQVVELHLDLSTAHGVLTPQLLAPFQHTVKKLFLDYGSVDIHTLDALATLPHLEKLVLYQTRLPVVGFPTGAGRWPKLQRLVLFHTGLTDITSLSQLTNLTHLRLEGFPDVTSIEPLIRLTALQELKLIGFDRLVSIHTQEQLPSLERLVIARCPLLNDLNVTQMPKLKVLVTDGKFIMRNEPEHAQIVH